MAFNKGEAVDSVRKIIGELHNIMGQVGADGLEIKGSKAASDQRNPVISSNQNPLPAGSSNKKLSTHDRAYKTFIKLREEKVSFLSVGACAQMHNFTCGALQLCGVL